MGKAPTHRLIRLVDGKWTSIGGAWPRDGKEGLSVSIELTRGGEKIKCLLVPNNPDEKKNITRKSSTGETPKAIADLVPQLDDQIPF